MARTWQVVVVVTILLTCALNAAWGRRRQGSARSGPPSPRAVRTRGPGSRRWTARSVTTSARPHARWSTATACYALALIGFAAMTATVAQANHIANSPCAEAGACAGHEYWPRMTMDDVRKTPKNAGGTLRGKPGNSDELLGWHGSDTLYGGDQADVLWADHIGGKGQLTTQTDRLYGGAGDDYLYSARGTNILKGGPGNDAIKARYGRGIVDCGPGRDIVYLPKKRRKNWTFISCEKFEYRSESGVGHGLKTPGWKKPKENPSGQTPAEPQPEDPRRPDPRRPR